jgi:hypothetical protein
MFLFHLTRQTGFEANHGKAFFGKRYRRHQTHGSRADYDHIGFQFRAVARAKLFDHDTDSSNARY